MPALLLSISVFWPSRSIYIFLVSGVSLTPIWLCVCLFKTLVETWVSFAVDADSVSWMMVVCVYDPWLSSVCIYGSCVACPGVHRGYRGHTWPLVPVTGVLGNQWVGGRPAVLGCVTREGSLHCPDVGLAQGTGGGQQGPGSAPC